jgi:HTH-type transcriptional regulator, cell division transcriptional repressor
MLKTEQQVTVFSDEGDDTLGGRLSSSRDAAGITIPALAKQLGVGEDTVIAWESDRAEPRPSLLRDIAGIFGVSPIWLMTGAGEAPPEMSEERALEAVKIELARLQSAYKDMGRLIEATGRQLERLDYQMKLRSVSKDIAH